MLELYWLSAELYLDIQYFSDESESSEIRKRGVIRAYSAALALTTAMNQAHSNFDLFNYIPGYLFRMLFTAACVMWKVLNSSYHRDVDFHAGKAVFNEGLSALRKCSVENNDIPGRQTETMAQLWHGVEVMDPEMVSRPPTVKCTSRVGACLMWDCLFYWREHVGGQHRMGLQSSTTGMTAFASRTFLSPFFGRKQI